MTALSEWRESAEGRRVLAMTPVARAAWHVRRCFLDKLQPIDYPVLFGLGRYVIGPRQMPPIPRGWRALKEPDRNAVIIMPLWLYWPVRLWRERYSLVFGTLMRLGLWELYEGDYYVNGAPHCPRWLRKILWCLTHDADAYGGPWKPLRAYEHERGRRLRVTHHEWRYL